MDRSMASSLPTEKLNRNNYASWSYKMHQYLLGHGYWSYVEGANDAAPESTHRDFPAWEQSASRILYCFASSVGCMNAKGCVGKSEEDLRREHHSQEASAPTGVEQPTTTRFVGGGLHLKDQGHL